MARSVRRRVPSGEPAGPPVPEPAAGESPISTILVVDGDDGLSYLLARYAKRGGFGFRQVRADSRAARTGDGQCSLWLPSLERLEAIKPREGLVGDDTPVIVCSSSGEEGRVHLLGADYCVQHPLRYQDFLAALRAVGCYQSGDTSAVPRTTETGQGDSSLAAGYRRD